MDIVELLKQDYAQFPKNQTYRLYAEDVYFEDPLNRFQGLRRYQQMIGFIERWFMNVQMDLHSINRQDDRIKTQWTLSWQVPLPWKPQMVIAGHSELRLNRAGLICRHIDHWDCSRIDVLMRLFQAI